MKDFVSRFRHGLIAAYCPSLPGGGSGNLLPDQSNSRNNITLTSFSQSDWTSSQQGRTLYFDGVDNYGTTQRQIFSGRSIVSVMTWAQTVSGTQIEIGEGDSNTFRAGFGLSGDGNSYIANSQGGGLVSNFCFASWSAFQGQAVCIVSVLDVTQGLNTDRAKIYIQGISRSLSYSGTGPLTSSPIGTFTGPTQIGRRPTNDNYSTGNLYCIAVWDRVITAEEAMQLYVLGPRKSSEAVSLKGNFRSTFAKRYAYKPAKPRNYSVIRNRDPNYSTLRQGLVAAYCPSISGQGNVLPDLVGGNHGTLTNMTADDWVSSVDGRALDFDGSNDTVNTNQSELFNFTSTTSQFTITLFGLDRSGNRYSNAIAKNINGASSDGGFTLVLSQDSTGLDATKGHFAVFMGASVYTGVDFIFPQNEWRHIAIVVNMALSGTARVEAYIDGVSTGTKFSLGFGTEITTNSRSLRIGSDSAGNFVHDGQLDDIRIYSRALSESEIKLLASKRGIGLEPRKPKITFTDLGVQKTYSVVRVKETDYGTLRQGLVGAWCPSLPNGGSGNTLPDVSGYGNHGVLTNMGPEDWVSGQYGRTLEFDGTDTAGANDTQNRVTLSKDFGVDVIGFSAWVNPLTLNKRGICASWPQNDNPRFAVTLLTNGTLEVYRGQNTQSTAALSTNRWQHIFVFSDGNNTSYYINGVFSNTANQGGIGPGLQTNFLLGNNYWGALEGYLDDVRIYDRNLSLAEIRLLASRPGIGLRQESHRNTFYQFPSFQPALARRSSAIIGGGIT